MAKDYDIIVVGAGLAGLSAARKVKDAGKRVLVLEARDRVGGRVYTAETKNGGAVDFGAVWLNDRTQPAVTALAKEAGNTIFTTYIEGQTVALYNGKAIAMPGENEPKDSGEGINLLSASDLAKRLEEALDPLPLLGKLIDWWIKDVDVVDPMRTPDAERLDSMSARAGLKSIGIPDFMMPLLEIATATTVGGDLADSSFLQYLVHFKAADGFLAVHSSTSMGGQYQHTRNGNQSMATYLAGKVEVKLNHMVTRIDRNADGVKVTFQPPKGERQTLSAEGLVLAIPPGMYTKIAFTPELPILQRQGYQRSYNGTMIKVCLIYDTPWWIEDGYSGQILCVSGEDYVTSVMDTSDGALNGDGPKPRAPSLTAFLAGSRGQAYMQLPEGERQQKVIDVVATGFKSKEKAQNVTEVLEHLWNDEFDGAPVTLLPAGGMRYFQARGKSVDRFWIAGTENAPDHQGYMEGAVKSGNRAGDMVVEWFKKQGK